MIRKIIKDKNGIVLENKVQTYTCKECGKTYSINPYDGNWNKDNQQALHGKPLYLSYEFCSYECGKKERDRRIQASWKARGNNRAKAKNKLAVCIVCGKIEEVGANYNGSIHVCKDKSCQEAWRAYKRYNIPLGTSKHYCETCGKEIIYKSGQGSWNKDNQLVTDNRTHTYSSYRFCSYECGKKSKEKHRRITNINKTGFSSLWQDPKWRDKQFLKHRSEGTLFTSKGETEIREYLESLGIKTEKYIVGNGLSKDNERIEIDIYIPDKKIGIEYNGAYFHSLNRCKEGRITSGYHYNKSLYAKDNGIELIHVWEDQWKTKQDIIKDVLKARLGIISNTIYARKCKIKELDNQTYKKFCIKHHVQGYRPAKIKLGLFYNDKLVQLASFNLCKDFGNRKAKYEYEWIRGAIAFDTKVIGGTSKLFQYFLKTYNPSSVLCYADWNLFNGKGYESIGFKNDGYTGPDKFFIKQHSLERIMRSPFRYKEMKQLVQDKKIFECCGAGSIRFIWERNTYVNNRSQ